MQQVKRQCRAARPKALLILFGVFVMTSAVHATKTPVTEGKWQITVAVYLASAGDTLVLTTDGGLYTDTLVTIDKDLTIMADPGLTSTPIWSVAWDETPTSSYLINLQSALELKGITFGQEVDSLGGVKFTGEVPKNIIIEDCIFRQLTKGAAVRGTDSTTVDSLIIMNTIVHGASTSILNLDGDRTTVPGVLHVIVENSSFHSCDHGLHSKMSVFKFYAHGVGAAPEDSATFYMNHVTLDSAAYIALNVRGFGSGTVINSLMTRSSKGAISWKEGGPVTVSYTIITADPGYTSGYTGDVIVDTLTFSNDVVGNLFVDPDNGDLMLVVNSPAIDAADDGTNLGDNRWGDLETTAIGDGAGLLPSTISLKQNYPNPFNPSTTIGFSLPYTADMTLTVYDLTGREVAKLVQDQVQPGEYEVRFDGSNLTSGVYFYRLQTNRMAVTKKMVLLK